MSVIAVETGIPVYRFGCTETKELPLRVRNYYLLATHYTVARSLTDVYIESRSLASEFESEVERERTLRRIIKALNRRAER